MSDRVDLIEVILPNRNPLKALQEAETLVEGTEPQKFYYLDGLYLEGDVQNQNGRIYPAKEIAAAVSKLNQTITERGPIPGELDHPCLLHSAKALTTRGWKAITDVAVGDEVYSLDPSGKVRVQNVLEHFEHDFDGDLISFVGRSINTKVTPNHKMVLRNRYGKLVLMTAKEIFDRISEGDSAIAKYSIVRAATGMDDDKDSTCTIGGLEWDINVLAAFMGLYLSEGYCSLTINNDNREYYSAGMSQNRGINTNAFYEVLDASPLEYRVVTTENEFGNLHDRFVFGKDQAQQFNALLYELGKCYQKYIPTWFIEQCASTQAEIFIDHFILGDGRGTRHEAYMRSDCFSTSEKLIDGIAHMAGIAGIPTRKFCHVTEEDYLIGDRVIKAENKRPLWFLNFAKTKGVYLDARFIQIDKVPYTGKVYCIEVDNDHTFLAMDNGFSFWTGNSSMNINFDRLAVAITEMRMEGSNGMGRMRVVPEGLGKIVEGAIKAGIQVGVSSRGTGNVDSQGNVSDFDIVTIDAVLNPSAPNAYPSASLAESIAEFQDGIEAMKLAEYAKYDPRAQYYLEKKLRNLFIAMRDEVVWR